MASTRFLAAAICSSMGSSGAAKSPEPPSEQKVQPPVPSVPSRFGQVQPEESESLYTFSPYCAEGEILHRKLPGHFGSLFTASIPPETKFRMILCTRIQSLPFFQPIALLTAKAPVSM